MNKTIAEFLNGDTYSIRYTFDGDIAYKCNEEVRKYIRNQNKEIERLNNIIKEVREYIGLTDEDREYIGMFDVNGIEILDILDKVEENNYVRK